MKHKKSGKEGHYKRVIDIVTSMGGEGSSMGCGIAWAYHDDPRHVLFTLSRYKFAAKMLSGKKKVLEVGCGDGFASRLLLQEVKCVVGVDIDDDFINDANSRLVKEWEIDFRTHDMIGDGPIVEGFDGALSLDVLEHIPKNKHAIFIGNICKSLNPEGVLVIGMPSLGSQEFASSQSKLGHVSCMSQDEFRISMLSYFSNVFSFSMNDEVVHTGYGPMAQYLLCVCCAPKLNYN